MHLAMRAVHVEIIHTLDTSSFIQCFRRFIPRRGPPKEYLPELQWMQRRLKPEGNFSPGDVVMIVDQSSPSSVWPLGRVLGVNESWRRVCTKRCFEDEELSFKTTN